LAVLDDYHHAFFSDAAIQRLCRRVPVDAFFEALPSLELIAQTGNHAYHVDLAAATQSLLRSLAV
jgi:hypothetical protein